MPLIMAVNKVDNPGREPAATEAYRLGVEDVVFISAAHGLGVTDLLDTIIAKLCRRVTPVRSELSRSARGTNRTA